MRLSTSTESGIALGGRISVSIVEDDDTERSYLEALIRRSPGMCVVSAFASAEPGLARIPEQNPNVVLMDLHLPGQSGIDCIRRLLEKLPKTNIIVWTIEQNYEKIFDALAAGASGYLIKGTAPADLLRGIEEVAAGGAPMSPVIARLVLKKFQAVARSRQDVASLTRREEQVLKLLAEGCLDKEIADELGISTRSVGTHCRSIYKKLHAHNRTQAVIQYLRAKS